MFKKIVLGTANFDQKYGFKKKKFDPLDFKELFNLNSKINNNIDTAFSYKKSLNIIKKYSNYRQIIYSKIPCIFKNNIDPNNIEKIFQNHLKSIDVERIYSLSFHNPKNLKFKRGRKIHKKLQKLKDKKIIKKIGISVNDPKELELIKNFDIDLVQFPLNIFDQRFIEKKNLNLFKKKKIEIQIRSIFLQGTLLEKETPKKLNKFSNSFNDFRAYCKRTKKSQLFHCVNFIKNINCVDSVVVGASNLNEFKEIIKAFKYKSKKFNYFKFKKKNKNLIMPVKWKK